MKLICVPPGRATECWPLGRSYIFAAMDRVGRQDGQGVQADVLTGTALLWLAIDGANVVGAVVTKLVNEGGRRICEIVACGSDDIASTVHLIADLERYARAEECDAMGIMGRKGWERALPDYKPIAVIFEKELA